MRENRKTQETLAAKATESISAVAVSHESQTQILDKALALIAAKGPLEFQAVQAMNQTGGLYTEGRYDPSDEAEFDKLKAFGMIPGDEEGTLNGNGSDDEELEWLRAHGVPGADF